MDKYIAKLKKKNIKKGFSIGEVMLSVFILGTTMTALISLYSTGFNHLTDERDNSVATLLAQEGVELIRNTRDNNWVTGGGSFDGLDGTSNCSLDYANYSSCGNDFSLNYNGSYYTHSAGDPTSFRRRIEIEEDGDSRVVTSIVVWDSSTPPDESQVDDCNASNKCVFSQSTLTDWGE